MKQALTTLTAFLLIIVNICGQEPITGIGKLKIDLTFDEALSVLQLSHKDYVNPNEKKVDFLDMYYAKENFLLVYDSIKTPKDILFYYDRCPESKILILKKYSAAGIDMKRVKLKFYKQRLISIEIPDPSTEFTTAIESKYGKGSMESEKKTVTCTSIYGQTNYDENSYKTYWNKGGEIEALYYLSNYRDSKCKEQFLQYFIIKRPTLVEECGECEKRAIKRIEENQKQQLKEKLSDF